MNFIISFRVPLERLYEIKHFAHLLNLFLGHMALPLKGAFRGNHFISSIAPDSVKFKKPFELRGKSKETFHKKHIEIVTLFNVKLYQNNISKRLL